MMIVNFVVVSRALSLDGVTPHIGANGNWWIGSTDTGVQAQGNNGNDGVSPHIGANGNWWIGSTDTGVQAQGAAGNDAIAPKVQINPESNEWEISIDGGTNYTPTGVKATGDKGDTGTTGAQGDAIFAKDGIDLSDPDNVTFTLAGGITTITLPRTSRVTVGFKSYVPLLVISDVVRQTGFTMSGITEKEFVAITATIEHEDGSTTQVQTKSATQAWQVSIAKPLFENGTLKSEPVVEVEVNSTVTDGTQAVLTVSVLTTKGEKISTSRILRKVNYQDFLIPIESDGKVFDMANIVWLSKQLEDGTLDTKGKVYTLTCDIDMEGLTIHPIGSTTTKAFEGTFDGQEHTIKNYVINNSGTTEQGIGLFGISTGTIMNLNAQGEVSQSISNDEAFGTGGILGVNLTGGKVLNCSFSGNVSSTDCWFVSTGGVVGLNQDGLVAGCSYRAATGKKVTANNGQGCGGVVGANAANETGATAYIIGCYNTGEISPTDNCWSLGGVAGMNLGTDPNVSLMVACYNVGVISGATSTTTGGVAGATSMGSVTACYNTVDITASGSHAPYLIAGGDKNTVLSNCFWLSTSAQAAYSPDALPDNLTNCKALSRDELNSAQTVAQLNAAIDAWNVANKNLCPYKFAVGDQYPILIGK